MSGCVDWSYIDGKYPTNLVRSELSEADYRKLRTIELYDYLPLTTLEERQSYIDIRDAVIDLNYAFFGYVASHKFVNNNYISYEDKFQSALLHFMEMWGKYKFVPKYRGDISFAVFFRPRITECMEREFDEVKYSLRRALCIEVGNQIGKKWTEVTYDDLANPNLKLSAAKVSALQAIFGTMYVADLETHAMFIPGEDTRSDIDELYSDNYDNLTDMLIHEMVDLERRLTDKDLLSLAELLSVPSEKLQKLLPEAEEKLHAYLLEKSDINSVFSSDD